MPQFEPFADNLVNLLPPTLSEAVLAASLPGLREGPQDDRLIQLLNKSSDLSWGGLSDASERLLRSALWLLAGDLDRSHSISQEIETSNGSFWHGIMHRREADFSNAKYWFRRVGHHPVFQIISDQCGRDYVDPFAFVDACQHAIEKECDESLAICGRIQWIEWQALTLHCVE